jgi:hypothetical protein
MVSNIRIQLLAISLLALCGAVGCSKTESLHLAPVVSRLETQEIAPAPQSAQLLQNSKQIAALNAGLGPEALHIATPSNNPVIAATVTFNKDSILKRTFLYGADLQYSSISDGTMSLILQSESPGHTPVYFRIVDDRLQMVADQKFMYESDVNHPERLIAEFSILKQDASTVTVQFKNASPVINTIVADKKAPPVRTSWLRSAEFVQDGQYMMYETSIEMADGSIAEFMETFFPRETVVPADSKPLLATADLEPLAERYRFLDSGDVYVDVPEKGRVKTKVANRFYLAEGKTIDWYVTPNIPEEYLPQIKTAIEGWNRYSQKMWSRDMIRFVGKLPDGVKLGDPRYNVVNWDSISQAGAAYESQSADPYTGIQSHSLIYLPKAWVNIGKQYWDAGEESESAQTQTKSLKAELARGSFLGQKLPIRCVEDASERLAMESRMNPDAFSRELLKGVLFHEVGHALGLAHNFKGSLSYEPNDPKSSFSTSIMDYNQYQLEKAAFDKLDSSSGPLLEYDRQIISILYNGGKDVASSDATLPACADEEADSLDDGVDPLCIRYDAGHDPSLELGLSLSLVKDDTAVNRDQRSLPAAIRALATELGDTSSLKTKDDVALAIKKQVTALNGIVGYYYVSGAQSVSYMSRANIRTLRTFKADSLPVGYDEMAMRERAIEGIRYVATTPAFEDATNKAIETFKSAVQVWLTTSPYFTSISQDKQPDELKTLMKDLSDMPDSLGKLTLSKLRERFFADLKASEKAPFYLLDNGTQTLDFERETAQILARAATEKNTDGSARRVEERIAAAKSLQSFLGTAVGATFITDASSALVNEAKTAKSISARTDAINVYKALTVPDKPDAK